MNLVLDTPQSDPILPRSSSASRPPGRAATTPSSAPPCRSSANCSPKPRMCAPASACSTWPPATATRRWRRRAASPTSRRPTTCRRFSTKAARARPKACRCSSRSPMPSGCPSTTQLRRRAVDVRRDVHARPQTCRARDAARLRKRRPDRHGELDARRLHRPVVQGDRHARAAARGD